MRPAAKMMPQNLPGGITFKHFRKKNGIKSYVKFISVHRYGEDTILDKHTKSYQRICRTEQFVFCFSNEIWG